MSAAENSLIAQPDYWPCDHPGLTFIGRALLGIGAAKFGDAWRDEDLKARSYPPAGRLSEGHLIDLLSRLADIEDPPNVALKSRLVAHLEENRLERVRRLFAARPTHRVTAPLPFETRPPPPNPTATIPIWELRRLAQPEIDRYNAAVAAGVARLEEVREAVRWHAQDGLSCYVVDDQTGARVHVPPERWSAQHWGALLSDCRAEVFATQLYSSVIATHRGPLYVSTPELAALLRQLATESAPPPEWWPGELENVTGWAISPKALKGARDRIKAKGGQPSQRGLGGELAVMWREAGRARGTARSITATLREHDITPTSIDAVIGAA